ncbi:neuronal acetylcholine receptor subunit alpha-10-like [Haliotis cracherodii]|uniref:neuronal acetylcholine receptor subunit alpha-10-like n=1 Tax=Haliotis cracherodii TaxID=6455 RepID=UPI0039EBDF3B
MWGSMVTSWISTVVMLMMFLFQASGQGQDDYFPEQRKMSNEQRLMRELTDEYETSVRPVYSAADAVDIGLGLTLTQILDLDEKNQVLTTNVWLEAEWYDERLNWNSSLFGDITSIRIPCEKIWLPDIVLYNSVDDYTSGYMPSLAMVYNDSRVFWGPVVRFRSSCKIDITFFPFDDQLCKLKLGSWAYNGFQVDVWNRSHTMDLSNFVDNGEWELIGVKVQRNVVVYNCCDEPFPDVTFYIHLRRRIKYYFMNIIIPCIILSFLCLAGFLLPPESGEKITLGLSVLLTITVFMLMVADKMPQTSESISVISIYLMVVLATSCLSVLSSVLVLGIHHQRGQPKHVPHWLKIVSFSFLSPVLCIKKPGQQTRRRRQANKDKKTSKKCRVAMEDQEFVKLDAPKPDSIEQVETPPMEARGGHSSERPVPTVMECVSSNNYSSVVRQLMNLIHKKHLEELKEDEIFREWRDVAFVLDRLLFVVFLFATVISTVFILEMRPDTKKFDSI